MSQPITTTQIRQNVVNEAITRATKECLFLSVYEYTCSISDNTAWATLLEHEPPPTDSLLLCTVNPNGVVEWKHADPDLTRSTNSTPDSTPDHTLTTAQVTFNNVSITIAATDPAAAYALLCKALAGFAYTTHTFYTHADADESEERCTSLLFPSPSEPAATYAQLPEPAGTPIEGELLSFIVDFCSERLEWFCSGCYRDSPELVWLETARSLLGYPALDFAGISFLDQPLSQEASKPTYFVIQSREASEEDTEWEEWSRDTDPAHLLHQFVNSVSEEQIDDVNRYWRVRETLNPDNLTHDNDDAESNQLP